MSQDMKRLIVASALFTLTGCYAMAPQWEVRQAQLQTYQVHRQGQVLAGELSTTQQMAADLSMQNQQLAMEKQQLEMAAAELQQNLQVANQRLGNLSVEREQLHNQYKTLLTNLPAPNNPLSGSANSRFEDLARRYPDFEFDPITGVSKFNGDLLFASGSDQVQSSAQALLKEFAAIMNDGDASQFNILVVGHTDDNPVTRETTKAKHGSNWDLSAHRATAVVKTLSQLGISEPRMGAAGYSKFQPAVPNTSENARQQNRRVEIFILAPDAAVAGRDTQKVR